MKKILILCFTLLAMVSVQAQHNHDHGNCGVTIEDQEQMSMIFDHQEISNLGVQRGEKIYIPVKFHMVSETDGSGLIKQSSVLSQLCRLNRDYRDQEFVFYLKDSFDYNYIKNTNIYNSPGDNASSIRTRKDDSAMNIFICKTANTGNPNGIGTTLGFYSPSGDYIVIRQREVLDSTNTLSHEAGHFFNLRHTFFGWEGEPYDVDLHGETIDFVNAPGSNVQIEKMDGSNCTVAADRICDTPPDYNFGIRENGCRFSRTVFDINGDQVEPMMNNQMSYFNGCDSYQFTEGQTERMLGNYNGVARNYLRSGYIPNENEMQNEIELLSPAQGETMENYNSVSLNWSEVEGATYYLVEVFDSKDYFYHYTRGLSHIETRLSEKKNYFWSVIPFNEANTCLGYSILNNFFKTGESVTSTENLEAVEELTIFPNPSSANQDLKVQFTTDKSEEVNIIIFDISGRKVFENEMISKNGGNRVNIPSKYLEKGIYVLTLQTERGSSSRKVVIQ